MSRPRPPFLLGYALRQAPAPAFLSSAPAVFLSSYCTNFIDCGLYKNSVKNCHAFSLQSNNQYLAQSNHEPTTYSFLLIWRPFYQIRKLRPLCLSYMPRCYVRSYLIRCLAVDYLYSLGGLGVAVVSFEGEYAAH